MEIKDVITWYFSLEFDLMGVTFTPLTVATIILVVGLFKISFGKR